MNIVAAVRDSSSIIIDSDKNIILNCERNTANSARKCGNGRDKKNPLLESALYYANRGWHVLPLHSPKDGRCSCNKQNCHSPGKHPWTPHGLKDATTDQSQVRAWWRMWPDANVGIATGPDSGLLVLDVDVDVDKGTDGEASLHGLETEYGALPRTIEAETGRGGRHILFRYPQDCTVNNSAGKVGDGIDVRGDGGYIVAPPSVHPNGNKYMWKGGHSPIDVGLAEAPDWLFDLTVKSNTAVVSPKPNVCGKLNGSKIQEGARNDVLFRRGCSMRAKGLSEAAIQAALWQENLVRCDPPLVEEEVAQIASSVADYDPSSTDRDDNRPQIRVVDGQLDRMVAEAEQATLRSPDLEIYQFANRLVRPIRHDAKQTDEGVTRDRGAVTLHPVVSPWLVVELTKTISWLKWDARKDDWKTVDCPSKVASGYLAQVGNWKVPDLNGIIEAPTLREDGSVLEEPGFDEATGLLFEPQGAEFPPIPDQPTKMDAKRALAKIKKVIADFPFVSDEHESAALAAILTALVRRSLRSAPMFGFTAPTMGSGKSLLADVVSLIATGRDAAVMSQAHSGEEDKKRLLSILLHGDPIVVIDNVEREIFGDALCTILTQTHYQDRILGENTVVSVPTNTMFIATGNNLTFRGDMLTRALLVRIDAQCERPEEREFTGDLRQHVRTHRGELVTAILTVLRAYHVVGRPAQGLKPFGRFEEWSDLVRSALVWLGEADPCLTREEIEVEDPERRGLESLLEAWWAAYEDNPVTIAEVLNDVEFQKEDALVRRVGQALWEVAGDRGGRPSTKRVAWYLRKKADKIINGRKIEKAGDNGHKVAQWRVTHTGKVADAAKSGLPGLSGFVSGRTTENAAERDPELRLDTSKGCRFFDEQPGSNPDNPDAFFDVRPGSNPDNPDNPDKPDKEQIRAASREKIRRMFDPNTPEGKQYLDAKRRRALEARVYREELERKRARRQTNGLQRADQ